MPGRQRMVSFCVAQVMRNVREPGLARADAARPFHRLLQRRVAGMRFMTQRRKNHRIQAFQQRKALFGNRAHVRQIGHVAEAKPDNAHLSVSHRNAKKLHSVHTIRSVPAAQCAPERAWDTSHRR